MSWINKDDLIEWLHTEEDEMQDVGFEREMYEASYIRKHVMEIGDMNDKGGNKDE